MALLRHITRHHRRLRSLEESSEHCEFTSDEEGEVKVK